MKTDHNSRQFFIAAALFALTLACLFPLNARAEYPERPVTMDVAFAPGGSMDMASRAMAAGAMTALLGGHVDVCSSGPEHVPYARAGQVRMLAYTEEKRNPKQPDVPTLKELGYDFVNETVFSVFGPAGLPADVVTKLESAFTKAKDSPEVKTVMDKLDLLPVYYNSNNYDRFLKDSWVRLEKTLKETGLIKEPATQPY